MQRHCADCHGPDTQEGNFRVDTLTTPLDDQAGNNQAGNNQAAIGHWGRVVARLEAGEMPPPGEPRATPQELADFLRSSKTSLAQAAKSQRAAGRVRIRRLNGLEYEQTVHDLLGIQVPLRDLLPEDELADGFSNASGSLSISPVHIHQYIAAADVALAEALARQPQPAAVTHHFSYGHTKEKPFYGHGSNWQYIRVRGDDLWFYKQTHIEVPAVLRQFAEVTYQSPGWYRIRIRVASRDGNSHWTHDLPTLLADGGFRHGQHLAFNQPQVERLAEIQASDMRDKHAEKLPP